MASTARPRGMETSLVAAAYDRWAPIYDLIFGQVFTSGRRQSIDAAERVGGRVLEVGVGTGISLPQYRPETLLTGIDISESMLKKACQRAKRLGLTNVQQLAVMDAENLEFGPASFDVVVAQYVVTAVPDPEAALDEWVRVIRPGGELIIATRIGAGRGLRGTIERALMPITSRLGWRTEFPLERYHAWAAANGLVEMAECRPLPPLGHFSMLRYRKLPA